MARKKDKEKNVDEKDFGLDFNSITNLKKETIEAIWAVMLFVMALFFMLASLNLGGRLGSWLYGNLKYLFGIGYFLLPLMCTMLGISFVKSLRHNLALPKVLGAILFFISGLALTHLILPSTEVNVVGAFIGNPLIAMVDVPATFLFLVAFIVVAVVVMFDTPIHLVAKSAIQKIREGRDKENLENKKSTPHIIETAVEDEGEPVAPKVSEPLKTPKEVAVNEPTITNSESKDKDDGMNFFFKKSSGLFTPPPLSILAHDKGKPGVGDIKANANLIKRTLQNFGIPVEMDEITIGPTVTRYALKPAEGVKLSKIESLQQNLALALAAQSLRIEAPIPGKSLVGIEVPNTTKTVVGLGTLVGTEEFQKSDKPLLVALGKMVSGKPMFDNLAKMPHLLIAGTTGSGKSVTVHALLTSLLYRNSPDMLKFIMVDAKRVELTLYNKIPHLLTPVITDAKKTIMALRWAAKEMDRRYDILEKVQVRDILSYHKNIVSKEEEGTDPMPYIVIVIDELADLMQSFPRELESAIVRLAQMSRAVGIHLIISTQRPSVNVITGLIKANIPTRIALKVGSQIDSRTIIDKAGAEKLVGHGDMLYVSQSNPDPIRIQSPFISEGEVKDVVKYFVDAWKDEVPGPEIDFGGPKEGSAAAGNPIFATSQSFDGDGGDDDELYEQARQTVLEAKKASTSYIQRKLRVGYARAARLMDMLEERGIISPGDGTSKPREIIDQGVPTDETAD